MILRAVAAKPLLTSVWWKTAFTRAMSVSIPVIDFDQYGLHRNRNVSKDAIKKIGSEVKDAFKSVGFCYLTNHGISEKLLSDYLAASRSFFQQPVQEKEQFELRADGLFGWAAVGKEVLNRERPGDLKESFDYTPAENRTNLSDFMEKFQGLNESVFNDFAELTHRFNDVLAAALGLESDSFMKDCHKFVGARGNSTALRTLYYPPIEKDGSNIKPGQIRCGEHTDYGTITFLYQDDAGGLEVKVPGGEFIPATPIPGTILVNIGDMMQRWTSDSFIATTHRVRIPEEEGRRGKCRQSIGYFVFPDDDFVLRCLDGSDKYEPISSLDFLQYRVDQSYY